MNDFTENIKRWNENQCKQYQDYMHELGSHIAHYRNLKTNQGKDLKELNLFDFLMFCKEKDKAARARLTELKRIALETRP